MSRTLPESVLAELTEAVLVCDLDERILFANAACERVFGRTPKELVGQSFLELVPERLKMMSGTALLEHVLLAAEGQALPIAVLVPRGERVMELIARRVELDGAPRTIVSLRPAIARSMARSAIHQATDPLHAAERLVDRFESLLRPLPFALALIDRELRYLWVNDFTSALNGVPPAAHLGRTVAEVLGAKDTPFERLLRATLADERGDMTRHELSSEDFKPERSGRIFDLTLYKVRAPSGRVTGLGVAADEITDRRRAERERDQVVEELRASVRLRDEFLTIASHELKTPLTPLALRLSALERRVTHGQKVPLQALRDMRRSLEKLSALINDLLDTSRIESGRLQLHPHVTSLTDRVRVVVESLDRPTHRIALDLPTQRPLVYGDPLRLDQVIANLLENAFRFSPRGSTVRVSVTRRDGTVLLSVHDEGIGIPAEQQGQLFERFFRARNARPSSYGGLGLGLYISRDIVERHGGRIWVESEEGHGATFHVLLPLVEPLEAEAHPAEHHPA
jgi:PAS domain S-box-containing protein